MGFVGLFIIYFLKEMYTFVQQGCFQFIKSDSKDILILRKISLSNKCCSVELCSSKNPEKCGCHKKNQKNAQMLKLQSVTFFGLKIIQNQYLRKYITSQCSKLSLYFSPIHNSKLILMFSNLSGTGRFSREIRAWHCVIASLRHVCKHKDVFPANSLYRM